MARASGRKRTPAARREQRRRARERQQRRDAQAFRDRLLGGGAAPGAGTRRESDAVGAGGDDPRPPRPPRTGRAPRPRDGASRARRPPCTPYTFGACYCGKCYG
ncbi:hypothetical protein [Streptomyces radicis]|uniref:Uncharacterized protein n=1 Tax=Streptomyces radicis TaxID=1750517 RepID=A0A3A9WSU4_9ACTN|nr:hypothetical protein [Streptomyces radicis]RKN10856.1 hypothetical protein D7319_06785 [Streptomyces radicis]RKN25120.1 hypothetical protein D7318_07640 [Streptomyces radicis]